ncbi:MAG: PAS domain S-box protein, partial [Promethearchaeota archaeon]
MIDNENDSIELIEKYRVIIENVNDLICIIDRNHPYKIKFINETIFSSVLNYSNEDIIDKSLLTYIHPEDSKDFKKFLKKGTDGKVNSQEIRFKNKNNKYIWFEYKIKKYKDKNNNRKLLLILKNSSQNKALEKKINESEAKLKNLMISLPEIRFWKLFYPKKYEEALRTSYEMLQKVIDNIPENIFWKDLNLIYLGCNQNYANFIGAENPEYVIGETNKDLLLEDLLPIEKILELEEKETHIIKTNQPEFHIIEEWVLKNGEKLWFDTNRIPLYDSEGNTAGILVTYDDITELKKAEEDLMESEEKFRTISERSSLGLFILQDETLKYINQGAALSLGYSMNELKEWKPEKYLQLFFPEDRDLIAKLAAQLQRGFRPERTNVQVRCIKKSKELMWVELFGQSINYRGKPAGLISAIDITQRKKAEEDLIESEEKYRHLFGSSPNMICLIDANRNIIDVNAAFLKFFKIQKEEIIGKDFLNVYHFSKEDLSLINAKYKELLKKGNIKPFEIKLILETNNSVWVNVQASFVETGIKTLIEVLMQDITNRKRSEEILQMNEARLEALLRLSQMGDLSEKEIADFAVVKSVDLTKSKLGCIFFLNEDESSLKVVSCSNQMEDRCNIKQKKEFFSKDINLWNEILIKRKPIVSNICTNSTNLFICISDMGERIYRFLCIPILEGEHIVAVTAVINKESNYNESDIDQLTLFMDGVWKNIQRKRARDALEKSESKYRDLLETSSMGILEYDFSINDYSYVNPKLLEMLGYDKSDNFNVYIFSRNIYSDDIKKFYRIIDKEQLEFKIYD